MAGEKKTLLENFLSLGALQIVSYIFPLITLPYLSRVLGVEKFGLVFFAQAFVEYFRVFTDYGFNLSATKEIATNRHNQNNISNIFNAVISIKILLVIFSFIIFILAILTIPRLREEWLLFILSFILVIGNAIFPVWFFQGMERMKYITFLNILARLIFILLIFVFIKQQSDYIFVPILNSIGILVAGIIGLVFSIKEFNINFYIPKYRTLKKQFLFSTEFFLSKASITLYTCTNTFFLGLITSNTMVAYYVAADKIYNSAKFLSVPISNVMYPYTAKNKDIKTFLKVFKLSTLANIVVCAFVFIFAKDIITLFYGNDMAEAYKILRIMCIGMFIAWNTITLSYPLLGAMGHTNIANWAVISASLFHITGLGLLYLANKISVFSITYLVILTECLILSINLYFIHKYKLFKIGGKSNE